MFLRSFRLPEKYGSFAGLMLGVAILIALNSIFQAYGSVFIRLHSFPSELSRATYPSVMDNQNLLNHLHAVDNTNAQRWLEATTPVVKLNGYVPTPFALFFVKLFRTGNYVVDLRMIQGGSLLALVLLITVVARQTVCSRTIVAMAVVLYTYFFPPFATEVIWASGTMIPLLFFFAALHGQLAGWRQAIWMFLFVLYGAFSLWTISSILGLGVSLPILYWLRRDREQTLACIAVLLGVILGVLATIVSFGTLYIWSDYFEMLAAALTQPRSAQTMNLFGAELLQYGIRPISLIGFSLIATVIAALVAFASGLRLPKAGEDQCAGIQQMIWIVSFGLVTGLWLSPYVFNSELVYLMPLTLLVLCSPARGQVTNLLRFSQFLVAFLLISLFVANDFYAKEIFFPGEKSFSAFLNICLPLLIVVSIIQCWHESKCHDVTERC